MEKAYDLKALAEIAKSKGLDLAEDAALIVYESSIEWLKKSATMSENKYDDMLMVALPAVDGHVREMIDKIDGEKG